MLISSISVGLIATIIFQVCPEIVINLFGVGNDLYMEFAVKIFKIYLSFKKRIHAYSNTRKWKKQPREDIFIKNQLFLRSQIVYFVLFFLQFADKDLTKNDVCAIRMKSKALTNADVRFSFLTVDTICDKIISLFAF